MLTVAELAGLKGCSSQYIKKMALENKLVCEMVTNDKNRKKYLFPLRELPAELQAKYYAQQAKGVTLNCDKPSQYKPTSSRPFDSFTAEERQEVTFWLDLVAEWQAYRAKPGAKKTEVDKQFEILCGLKYPDKSISIKTLYRKHDYIKQKDFEALIDKRGKALCGKTSIDDTVWQAFLSFYLDEAQHPIARCYEYTQMYVRAEMPELAGRLPSYHSFYRRIQKDIPEAVEVLGRQGEKAFRDRCAPYIRRVYDDMRSNEWWIADNHTFDVTTLDKNGKQHRLYLTAFFDARSGIFTGCHVTDTPSSQATLIALRKGILKYGIPDNIYVDNGREFLTFDVGGLGHRKKKPKDGKERFEPPPILKRLDINMTNAIVRNAKAKIIERRFRDIKDHLSRLFETYTGGSVAEKPERLKDVLKNGNIPLDESFSETVNTLLEWYFNEQVYGGSVTADRGKTRMEVYAQNLTKQRKASPEELNLMLMRSSRAQKVTRRGVHLDVGGQRFDYWNDDLLMQCLGQQVYYRYDPDDLSEVRIYDLKDQFVMTVPADNEAFLRYGASRDAVKEATAKVRRFEKATKEALKGSVIASIGRKTALDLVLADAYENMNAALENNKLNPKVVELHRAVEKPLLREAVGFDLDRMNRNALRNNGGIDDE
ncbi:MAG: Mu transposase C-terminal domain-containing protein [Oscillospiraceae bacterium]|jgi:hypothetical protein|nr:Mu transposase C-terminal domain-containing protein [Oscillospiraceae bacterium]